VIVPELPADIAELKRQVGRFVEEEVYPVEQRVVERNALDPAELAALRVKARAAGFAWLNMPASLGGRDLSMLGQVALEEVGFELHELLREVQRLSQDEGVNRAGIRRIIELESQVDALRSRIAEMTAEITQLQDELLDARMDAANATANAIAGLRRDVVPWQQPSTALVAWKRPRR
jgi:polyhydroxyalkanoate synthesis regulator phasin